MLSILDAGIVPEYQHIMDDLINSILAGDDPAAQVPTTQTPTAQVQPKTRRRRAVKVEEDSDCAAVTSQVHRDTLAALVGGGQTKYLDGGMTSAKIEAATDVEIEVLFTRYELKLGTALTKNLGSTLIHLYTKVVGMFLPIPSEEQRELATDLENDAFLEHSLNSTMCILYHNFSAVITPLTVALTTMKHCQFQTPDTPMLEPQQLTEIRDGGSDGSQQGS